MEWLWLLAIYPNTNFLLTVESLNGALQLTINAILLQNLPNFILRNSVIYFEIGKACKEIFAIPQDFSKICFEQSEDMVCGAVM